MWLFQGRLGVEDSLLGLIAGRVCERYRVCSETLFQNAPSRKVSHQAASITFAH